METKQVKNTELQVGNIVHFYGCRFEITRRLERHDYETGELVVCANGKWIDGDPIPHYFGPNMDWNFQGNHRAIRTIEI